MAYVLARTEPNVRLLGFDTRPLAFDFGSIETVAGVQNKSRQLGHQLGQGTDCAIPMLHAIQQRWQDVDCFCLLTDDESWAGQLMHPLEAVSQYREKSGRATKIVSTAFVAHGYSTVPRDDAGSMACIGFDEAAPGIITDFIGAEAPVIPQLAGIR